MYKYTNTVDERPWVSHVPDIVQCVHCYEKKHNKYKMYFCTNTTCISLQIQNVFLNKYTNTVDERPWVSHVPAGSGLATTPAGINNTALYNIIIIIKYQQCHCIYQHRHHYHHGQYHNNNQS